MDSLLPCPAGGRTELRGVNADAVYYNLMISFLRFLYEKDKKIMATMPNATPAPVVTHPEEAIDGRRHHGEQEAMGDRTDFAIGRYRHGDAVSLLCVVSQGSATE